MKMNVRTQLHHLGALLSLIQIWLRMVVGLNRNLIIQKVAIFISAIKVPTDFTLTKRTLTQSVAIAYQYAVKIHKDDAKDR